MKEFKLEIVTPDGLEFDGDVESLLVRTDEGDVQILAGHVDYMASLGTGRAKITASGKERIAACSGGFLICSGGAVKLVAVTFEFRDEIDLERAEAAKASAEEGIRRATDDKSLLLAKAKLRRALARIDVAGK
jgi:F-type H+-transporting ATPase subunit epsilon